jgi:leucine dehydrogenase
VNISVEFDAGGYDAAEARRRVDGIERTMAAILDEAAAGGTTPLAAADRLARRNLAQAADNL